MSFKRFFSNSSILFVFLTFSSFQLSKSVQKKVNKEIKSAFDTSEFMLNAFAVPAELSSKLAKEFTSTNFFSISSNKKIIGYAFIDKAPSKTAEFDYLVLLDENLIVKKAKVLVYREEYGGEIASTRWLKQFIGKNQHSSLIYRKDIATISGATISVKSMTNAVNNVLLSIGVLHDNKVL